MPTEIKYPATCLVHWPSGPIACCDKHAEQLIGLGSFMGTHIMATLLFVPIECVNCVNESEGENE